VNDRTSSSSSSAWDADVLPTGSPRVPADHPLDETDDPEVEQLVSDIAQTRSEMTGTVEELGDRLDPSHIAERTRERVREATIGKVETKVDDMTNAASTLVTDASETVQETGSGIVETIRRNPVPAALAGFGIGWLVLNRQPARTDAAWDRRTHPLYARQDDRWSGQPGVGDRVGDRAREASEAVGEAASEAAQAARQAAWSVGNTASDAASTVGDRASSVAWNAQRTFESNPLAIGAVAVAIGAAIGLVLPATNPEKRVMGQTGSRLIDKAEAAVTKPLEEMETASNR
jgi:hypothetical protein